MNIINLPVDAHVFSIQVVPNELCVPGQTIVVGRVVHANPLDVIAMRFDKDPVGRLDAAMAWLLEWTMRRLAQVERSL